MTLPDRRIPANCARLLPALLLLLWGCGKSPTPPPSQQEAPSVRTLESVENLSEAVANQLIAFSSKVQNRDFDAAKGFLSSGFQGTALSEERPGVPADYPHAARRVHDLDAKTPLVGAAPWLSCLEKMISRLESVEYLYFKTRGAEFPSSERGELRLTVQIIGRRPENHPWSFYGWATGAVQKEGGEWKLDRFKLSRFQESSAQAPFFTDVAKSAGLSHDAGRLGTNGATRFYWCGSAVGDIDGDGDFDLFSSSFGRNFLFRNTGDGHFEDITKESGLESPFGVTGSIFFDYDRDGDLDLFCSLVGWFEDKVPYGRHLHLYRNDGKGHFEDVSRAMGLGDLWMCGFSAIAADFDQDGWLDLYVCGYNRLDATYPDSWFDATNGTANALLLNKKGKGFVDVAAERGVAGKDWTFAAAAADFDQDGDQDIYVANDYGNNRLLRNDGKGHFEDVAEAMGVQDTGNGMGATWGDLDGDGDLDLYVSNMSSSAGARILGRLASKDKSQVESRLFKLASGNSVFRNDGTKFTREPHSHGATGASWAWSPALLDVDLDGRLDIYVSNGFISGDGLEDT